MWPRWRSGAVGSSPSLTRSGRPAASRSASAPAGRQSTALRASWAAVARPRRRVPPSGPMLMSRPRAAGARAWSETRREAARRALQRGPGSPPATAGATSCPMSDSERDTPRPTATSPRARRRRAATVLPTPGNGAPQAARATPLPPAGDTADAPAAAPRRPMTPTATTRSTRARRAKRRRARRRRAARPRPAARADGRRDGGDGEGPVATVTAAARARAAPRRVRIRKLRVLGVLFGLGILAVVSTVFGMLMAVTSDLPRLEEPAGAQLGPRRPQRRAARHADRQREADLPRRPTRSPP